MESTDAVPTQVGITQITQIEKVKDSGTRRVERKEALAGQPAMVHSGPGQGANRLKTGLVAWHSGFEMGDLGEPWSSVDEFGGEGPPTM